MIKVSVLPWVPPFAQGLVREFRVRWALEELGLEYEEKLLKPKEQRSESYLALQPFGQVPELEDGELQLFESGAIVQHLSERSEKLMPTDPKQRARVQCWLFAAMSSIEPQLMFLAMVDLFHAKEAWSKEARPSIIEGIKGRFKDLSGWMEGREYLECERFTGADLLMTTVLSIPRQTPILSEFPLLDAYHKRNTARPAYKKAMADHMANFERHKPKNA